VLSLSRDIAQRELTKSRRTMLRRLVAAGTVAVVSGLLWFSAPALAQVACAQTLPSPLKTFCPDTPAFASDVNENFQGVVTMLTNKTGPLSAPNAITTSALTVSPGVLDFGSRSAALINLYGTDYGIGIQNLTAWSRTGGNFAWFKNGTYAPNAFDPGTGGTRLMTLDANGNLNARGELAGASLRQTDCQWGSNGPTPLSDNQMHSMFCSPGRYMAGFRCYAQTYLDGDCAAYCCLP
jgi:uncharacterized protein YjeT (DUF2065 family)